MTKCLILPLTLIYFLTIPILSQTITKSTFDLDFSIGTVFPGKIQAAWYSDFKPDETYTFHNKQCFLLKVSADYNVLKSFSIGTGLNYVPFHIQNIEYIGIDDKTIHMFEVDCTIKYKYGIARNIVIKPCISFGYRHTFSSEPDAREDGFCLNSGIECLYDLGKNIFFKGDFGFFTQPYGGVKGLVYIRAWPVIYGNIGFGISI